MTLVRVAAPDTESHVALIVSALHAAGIPYFVHNAGIGSLFPGLQIAAYNARSIMVPESRAELALGIIDELEITHFGPHSNPTARDKWRMLVEVIFLGWMMPGVKRFRRGGK